MPRDVNGNYTLPSSVNPVVTLTSISSTWANTTLSDLASAMTNSLDRTGASSGMTGQLKATDGAVGAPGISFGSEITSGFYRAGVNDIRLAVGGADTLKFSGQIQLPQGAIQLKDGLVGTPTLSFVNEPTTGLYRNAAGDIRFAVAGADVFKIAAGVLSALALTPYGSTVPANGLYLPAANQIGIATNTTLRVLIDANGEVTISAPAAGNPAVLLNQVNGTEALRIVTGSVTRSAYQSYGINGVVSAYAGVAGTTDPLVTGAANGDFVLRTATQAVRICTNNGTSTSLLVQGNTNTDAVQAIDASGALQRVGWLNMPTQNIAANYTTVLGDSGKLIFHNSGAAHTVTIDSNANVPYPQGTVLTFVNVAGGGALTLAITTDTLTWMPSNVSGSRTLAGPGIATATKISTTIWYINGVNLS